MAYDVGLRAILEPEISDEKADEEVAGLKQRLKDIEGTDIELGDIDLGGSGGVEGALGEALQGGGGGGGGGAGGALEGALAGGAQGGAKGGGAGGLMSKMKGASSKLPKVALAGGVALGILKGVEQGAESSSYLRKVLDMFKMSVGLFFRPFGRFLASVLEPFARGALLSMVRLNQLISEDGLLIGFPKWFSEAIINLPIALAEAFLNSMSGGLEDLLGIEMPEFDFPRFRWSDFMDGELTWEDFIPIITWSVILNPVSWSIFIPLLGWDYFVEVMNWPDWVSPLRWVDWIPDFSSAEFLNVATWPDIGVSGFLSMPKWPNIKTGAFLGMPDWPSIDTTSFLGKPSWPSIGVASFLGWPSWPNIGVPDFLGMPDWPNVGVPDFLGMPSWPNLGTHDLLDMPSWPNIGASAIVGAINWPSISASDIYGGGGGGGGGGGWTDPDTYDPRNYWATGAVVSSPTPLGIAGEGNEAEAVQPLSHLEDMLDREYEAGVQAMAAGGGRSAPNHSRGSDMGNVEDLLKRLIRAVERNGGSGEVKIGRKGVREESTKAANTYERSREVFR